VDQSHRTVLRLAKRHADLDITLSDGEDRGERSPSRRSARLWLLGGLFVMRRRSGRYVPLR
jgi:hypothetical protein